MKPSEKFLFRAETLDGRVLHLTACCLGEALFKAENYVEKAAKEDLVESVSIVLGELLEDEESDADETGEMEGKREKLALVIGRIDGASADDKTSA